MDDREQIMTENMIRWEEDKLGETPARVLRYRVILCSSTRCNCVKQKNL